MSEPKAKARKATAEENEDKKPHDEEEDAEEKDRDEAENSGKLFDFLMRFVEHTMEQTGAQRLPVLLAEAKRRNPELGPLTPECFRQWLEDQDVWDLQYRDDVWNVRDPSYETSSDGQGSDSDTVDSDSEAEEEKKDVWKPLSLEDFTDTDLGL